MCNPKLITCDHCGETLPADCFCKECSHKTIEIEVEYTRDEMADWDGDSRFANYPIIETEYEDSGNVCINCCNCKIEPKLN